MEDKPKKFELEDENNVDLAIKQLRVLQSMFYQYDKSDNDLFKYTNDIIQTMEKARVEINTNYAEISRKLTELWNTGKHPKE